MPTEIENSPVLDHAMPEQHARALGLCGGITWRQWRNERLVPEAERLLCGLPVGALLKDHQQSDAYTHATGVADLIGCITALHILREGSDRHASLTRYLTTEAEPVARREAALLVQQANGGNATAAAIVDAVKPYLDPDEDTPECSALCRLYLERRRHDLELEGHTFPNAVQADDDSLSTAVRWATLRHAIKDPGYAKGGRYFAGDDETAQHAVELGLVTIEEMSELRRRYMLPETQARTARKRTNGAGGFEHVERHAHRLAKASRMAWAPSVKPGSTTEAAWQCLKELSPRGEPVDLEQWQRQAAASFPAGTPDRGAAFRVAKARLKARGAFRENRDGVIQRKV